MLVAISACAPRFAGRDNLVDILINNSYLLVAAAGMTKADLVKVTVFVTVPDLETVGIYRKARDQWMEGHAPAATYLVVAGLAHRDYLVEIEAIAAG